VRVGTLLHEDHPEEAKREGSKFIKTSDPEAGRDPQDPR